MTAPVSSRNRVSDIRDLRPEVSYSPYRQFPIPLKPVPADTAGMDKSYWVYILTNRPRGTLYVGVTSRLVHRVYEHRMNAVPGFTSKYRLKQLVYFEECGEIIVAIEREKRLKRWRRDWKIELIERFNPAWRDLYGDLLG